LRKRDPEIGRWREEEEEEIKTSAKPPTELWDLEIPAG
jgi:hypothetical protein